MTPKQIIAKLDKLKERQAKIRDEFRELAEELEEHFGNANDASEALERRRGRVPASVTWQGQRARHNPMESKDRLSNAARSSRNAY